MKGDISKLPVWAQDIIISKDMEIKRLEAELAQASALNPDAGSATVIADPYSQRAWAVGDVAIRFTNGDVHFDVSFDKETAVLEVTRTAKFSSAIAVLPSVSNTVRLGDADPAARIARELERSARMHQGEADMHRDDPASKEYYDRQAGAASGLRRAAEIAREARR